MTLQEYLVLPETTCSTTYFVLDKNASCHIASRHFDLFWLLWPYMPCSDAVSYHSARVVHHNESRVLLMFYRHLIYCKFVKREESNSINLEA